MNFFSLYIGVVLGSIATSVIIAVGTELIYRRNKRECPNASRYQVIFTDTMGDEVDYLTSWIAVYSMLQEKEFKVNAHFNGTKFIYKDITYGFVAREDMCLYRDWYVKNVTEGNLVSDGNNSYRFKPEVPYRPCNSGALRYVHDHTIFYANDEPYIVK